MKSVKKWFALLFAVAVLAAGCGSDPPSSVNDGTGAGSFSEGTTGSPIPLSLSTAHDGKAGAGSFSVYKFTTGSAGQYTVSITNISPSGGSISWTLHSDPFTTAVLATCSGSCDTGPLLADTAYDIVVFNGSAWNATYRITVAPKPSAPAPIASPLNVKAVGGLGNITVSWSAVAGATNYNLYWSAISPVTPGGNGVTQVAVASSPYIHDQGLSDNVTYYYVVTASDGTEESAPSAEASAQTIPAGAVVSTFPFAANFDDGTLGGWIGTGSWNAENTTYARSASYAASDSPGNLYQKGADSALVSPLIDLWGATAPKLTFWHSRYFGVYDWSNKTEGAVEASVDGGATWTVLAAYRNTDANITEATVDLAPYKDFMVLIRFRLVTDAVHTPYDGWFIDDVAVSAN